MKKKPIKSTQKREQQHLIAVQKLAKKELGGVFKRYHEERLRSLQKQIAESRISKTDVELSKRIAEFRFKHAKEINAALLSNPRFLPRFIGQHLDGEPGNPRGGGPGDPFDPRGGWKGNPRDDPRLNEFVITVKALERYFNIGRGAIGPVDLHPQGPTIISYPDTLEFQGARRYTITGERFGARPGSIYVKIRNASTQVNLTVFMWSDTAIMFDCYPRDVSGVPFHAEGSLIVQNAEGSYSGVKVIVEPRANPHISRASFSDSGRSAPWNSYTKEITLTSPPLPGEYELSASDTALGLALYIETYSYVPGVESEGNVSLLEGPYESGNCLQVKVKVKDDWYWDYKVTANFCINVPEGYSIPTGW